MASRWSSALLCHFVIRALRTSAGASDNRFSQADDSAQTGHFRAVRYATASPPVLCRRIMWIGQIMRSAGMGLAGRGIARHVSAYFDHFNSPASGGRSAPGGCGLWLAADSAVRRYLVAQDGVWYVRPPPVELDQPGWHHLQAVEEGSDLRVGPQRALGVTHPLVQPFIGFRLLPGVYILGRMGDHQVAA